MLRPQRGQTEDQLALITLNALEAALHGIAASTIPSYTIESAAAAIGYLLSGCIEQAARATRQIVTPLALPPASRQATPAELLGAVARLRS